tara:strand:- start:281 stop:649 length:369 start_codon:yes stop_codon:yes gene_type:complete
MSKTPKINFYGTATVTARVEVEVQIPIELAVTKKSVIDEGYCRAVEDGDPTGWYDHVEAFINENGLAAIKGFEIAEQDAEYVRISLMNAAEEWELVMPKHHQPPGTEVGSETTIAVTDVEAV